VKYEQADYVGYYVRALQKKERRERNLIDRVILFTLMFLVSETYYKNVMMK
jgi:hypothetical protein